MEYRAGRNIFGGYFVKVAFVIHLVASLVNTHFLRNPTVTKVSFDCETKYTHSRMVCSRQGLQLLSYQYDCFHPMISPVADYLGNFSIIIFLQVS
jgi:hypothetical protein